MIFARRLQLVLVEPAVRAEHPLGRPIVDVEARLERLDERGIAREMREHAQLDLRVVGGDQHVSGLGDERGADLASERRADRDVLQIRIAAREPPGRGHRLIERRVHAPGRRIHQRRQRVDVRALELLDAAPLQHEARQLVRERELLEHVLRGRDDARLAGLLPGREAHALEEDVGELLRRVDVELDAGVRVDALREIVELDLHRSGERRERGRVDLHPGALDRGEHGNQRPLVVAVDRRQPRLVELAHEPRGQAERQVGAFAGVRGERRRRAPRRASRL